MATVNPIHFITAPQNADFSSSESSPFAVTDTFVEKAVVTTLLTMDLLSHLSPFRWLFYLAGCSDSSGNPPSTDLPTPETQPSPQQERCPQNPLPTNRDADPAPATTTEPPAPIAECKPGDIRPCGPCEVGIQFCGEDHLWEAACQYSRNNLERSCTTGPAGTLGVGECLAGLQNCLTGVWSVCAGETRPRSEVCDGKDNDCDGETDEGDSFPTMTRPFYPGDPATLGVGLCRGGIQFCQQGSWITSMEPLLPQIELCDNQDNDCDGQTDEAGCGSKIGDPCTRDTHCESYVCITPRYYEGGYCSQWIGRGETFTECFPGHDYRRAICVNDSQMGIQNDIISENSYFCVVTCETDADCRTDENYQCKEIGESRLKACLPQHEAVVSSRNVCAD